MGTRPDEIRQEIDRTRDELAGDLDRLADRTVPTRVVERRWEGVKDKARSVADTVMGARDSAMETARDSATDAARSASDTVREAPQAVARRTRGNPLAVGLIAFGAGLLVAALLPDTEAERRAGAAVAGGSEGLVDKAREIGRDLTSELGDKARDAAEQVKETARGAAGHTAEQARESGRTTVDETRRAATDA